MKSFAEELYNAIIEIIKENKTIIKNEVRDELRNELATKEDILLVEERLGKKIELLNQKIEREIKLVRRDMIIINLVIILAMYAPEIIGKLLIFR
ncbi:hypothetical protein [Methanocaldococcus jannaschii]|uniref:hypothetical protein n=1 Tax=Methanocaldococcus jannaschii TaxID=2190 RepID=UPI0009FDEFB9|nr:hypothetical protein [Methanocaldococcus jannaschii]